MIDTFIIVIPLLLSPGPANLVSFALAARLGSAQILMFQLGIVVVYTIVAVSLGFLTNQITGSVSYATATLQLLGGLFIVYLGIRLAWRKPSGVATMSVPTFSKGLLLQVFNPKYPPVVLTVFASRPSEPTLVTAGVIVTVGAIGLITYSLAGTLVRGLLSAEKYLRVLDVAFGLMLCVVGVWIAAKAFITG